MLYNYFSSDFSGSSPQGKIVSNFNINEVSEFYLECVYHK